MEDTSRITTLKAFSFVRRQLSNLDQIGISLLPLLRVSLLALGKAALQFYFKIMKNRIEPNYLIGTHPNTIYNTKNVCGLSFNLLSLMTNKLTLTLLVLVLLQQGLGCLQLTVILDV